MDKAYIAGLLVHNLDSVKLFRRVNGVRHGVVLVSCALGGSHVVRNPIATSLLHLLAELVMVGHVAGTGR